MAVAGTSLESRKPIVSDQELVAPFVPSPLPIVRSMLELAGVDLEDKVFDLGSGDGRTVIMAAEKFGAEAVGVELDGQLFRESSARIAKLGLRGRARIVNESMFQADLRGATVVTLYQLTGVNQRLRPILERQLPAGARVVSHDFPVPGWKHTKLVTGVLEDGSPHAIYLYVLEGSKEEAMAADKRSYAAGKFGIELDGVMSGFVDEVDGGDATADVVVEKLGPDGVVHKHIAGVRYEDIVISCGTAMSSKFFDAVQATFDGKSTRMNGAIVEYDFNYKEVSRLSFFNALVTEIGFPALDGASKDAAKVTVKLSPERTVRKTGGGGSASKSNSKQSQKRWLPSNFRLTIPGLDCTRVNKIEAITIRQEIVENSIGQARAAQLEPSQLVIPNLVVTTSEAYAQTFYDWHEKFVIDGDNGQDQEKSGKLEYLTQDLKEALFTVTLGNLGIFRLTRDKSASGSEQIRRVTAEMYCERMTFTYGTGVALAVDDQSQDAGTDDQTKDTGQGSTRTFVRAAIPVQSALKNLPSQPPPLALAGPRMRFRS